MKTVFLSALRLMGWATAAVVCAALFTYRWNHEAVRVYDLPPLSYPSAVGGFGLACVVMWIVTEWKLRETP